MQTIILEGSSASGKTRTAKKLIEICQKKDKRCLLVEEKLTLMPIIGNRSAAVAKKHLLNLINETYNKEADLVIFDRLHLTPTAICQKDLKDFEKIELVLLKHNPLLVFLEIDEEKIPERIYDSINHRGPSWKLHIEQKGSRQKVVNHYIEAQRKLQKLINQTILPKVFFNTTSQDFDQIAQKLADMVL